MGFCGLFCFTPVNFADLFQGTHCRSGGAVLPAELAGAGGGLGGWRGPFACSNEKPALQEPGSQEQTPLLFFFLPFFPPNAYL